MTNDSQKRIFITSRGHYPHDVANWSIPVRPDTTESQREEIMWAVDGIQTAEMVWDWSKPKAPPEDGALRQDALSLLRWTIWYRVHEEHKPYGQPLSPTWLPGGHSKYISIPFADPKHTGWPIQWNKQKTNLDIPISSPWLEVFKVFSRYVWANSYHFTERPSSKLSEITEITFKTSHPTLFVKNITKE